MKMIKLSILAGALVLAGCASDSKREVDLNLHYMTSANALSSAQADKNAQIEVANAADSVSGSLQQLSAIEQARSAGKYSMPQPAKAQGSLAVRSSVDWNGPAETILGKLASSAGYRFSVIGNRPSIPVLVNLSENNQTISQIIRNVSYQISQHGAVGVYPKRKLIELRYFKH